MDVKIDSLEIKAGVDNEKDSRRSLNHEFDEAQFELQIEKYVERFLRQMVSE